jgi:hypothetical protein
MSQDAQEARETAGGAVDTPVPAPAAHDAHAAAPREYDEFEIGEHKVPWFLWLFFTLIVAWASVSWIQFFGY